MKLAKRKLHVDGAEELSLLLGNFDGNLDILSGQTGAELFVDGEDILIGGDDESVETAYTVLDKLIDAIARGEEIDKAKIVYYVSLAKDGDVEEVDKLAKGVVTITAKGKPVKCKTLGQKRYVDEIAKNPIVFGIGPAGTGKTYLAVAAAVGAYKNKSVEKIILTRPAVEAGERLGYLPGDLQSKVDPYLRPLYDALQEMFGLDNYQRLMEKGAIEIAPLAYMRGRTLNNAFIILDEAQNATKEQMKMVLTRMGEGSKMIITGDVTQIDLPAGKTSGLIHAASILKGVEGISVVNFSHKDVVRHPLVMEIIKAYAKDEHRK
ncbi:MAG: PhoH family protein [Clostridia bacterium]|nr:PhoH family protein [Clostridia bacterium]